MDTVRDAAVLRDAGVHSEPLLDAGVVRQVALKEAQLEVVPWVLCLGGSCFCRSVQFYQVMENAQVLHSYPKGRILF